MLPRGVTQSGRQLDPTGSDDSAPDAVRSATVRDEEPVPLAKAALDVFDSSVGTAYEMKVSGNNPGHEFYKDVLKALAYNRSKPPPAVAIRKLVFLTEERGIKALQAGVGKFTCLNAQSVFGFEIALVGL